jgi:hypothetical protein
VTNPEKEGDVLMRAIGELRTLPPANAAHIARIVDSAVAARAADAGAGPVERMPGSVRDRTLFGVRLLGLAAAGCLAGFLLRGQLQERPGATDAPGSSPSAMVAAAPGSASGIPVAGGDPSLVPVVEQFVLDQPGADRVTLIGDFNGWGVDSTIALVRTEGGLWTALVPLVPGRHTFAFLVNDSIVVLDPNRPRAKDPDFGVERSVVIVGRE